MIFYITLIFWIILDLFTKQIALRYFQEKINIIWDFFYLKYVENTWIAFSIQIPSLFLKIITIVLIIFIFYYYWIEKKRNKENKKAKVIIEISFWLILAWAIWNWIERLFFHKVIDFIWINYFSVFNLADSFISLWAIMYLWVLFFEKKEENKKIEHKKI